MAVFLAHRLYSDGWCVSIESQRETRTPGSVPNVRKRLSQNPNDIHDNADF